MMAMHTFSLEASIVFKSIQGLTTLVSQQVGELRKLSQVFCEHVGGRGPLLQSEVQAMAQASIESGGIITVESFAAPVSSVEQFIRGLGSFVSTKLDQVSSEDGSRLHLIKLIGSAFLYAAHQLTLITVERDSANERAADSDKLPPVMPYQLAKYSRAEFCATVRKHVLRLQAAKFSAEQIEAIEEEHGEFVRAYRNEEGLRNAIDACDHKTSFKAGWGLLSVRFPALYEFVGGLATIFPGTSTVEADFSRLRREKDTFRQNLSDFGLQCTLHALQHEKLSQAAAQLDL